MVTARLRKRLCLKPRTERINESTVRLLTNVHCKPTHFFFHSFIANMSYSLQTSFKSVIKDWADKWYKENWS